MPAIALYGFRTASAEEQFRPGAAAQRKAEPERAPELRRGAKAPGQRPGGVAVELESKEVAGRRLQATRDERDDLMAVRPVRILPDVDRIMDRGVGRQLFVLGHDRSCPGDRLAGRSPGSLRTCR